MPYLSTLTVARRHCTVCAGVVARSWLLLLLRGLLTPMLMLLIWRHRRRLLPCKARCAAGPVIDGLAVVLHTVCVDMVLEGSACFTRSRRRNAARDDNQQSTATVWGNKHLLYLV
jgi:hypothetical protein